ncbi:MAG TPA: HigA family addiction module antitoxin [Acidiferrobacterales bacterium]|nr:HigA family addiction module antitoxin [Acidiferrobacterales bacterium]
MVSPERRSPNLTNGRAGISSEMALRIAMATDTTAESWVDMQAYYDLWHARKKAKKLHVKRLTALPRQ